MGFDLSGVKPKSEVGTYFRNNCWYWRPLWGFVSQICDDVISDDDFQSGTFNDGHLIDENQCKVISEVLDELLESGEVEKYEIQYYKELDELPLEKCEYCDGTGTRNDEYVQGKCNGCEGKGERKSFHTNYPFEVENVKEFNEFIKESGGFEIW